MPPSPCRSIRPGWNSTPTGRNAFARDGKAAVTAFGKGSRAIARSPGPKEVTDTFSLKGFGAGVCGDRQGMSGEVSDLSEADRARVLAKSALFDPPESCWPDGRRDLVGMERAELAAEMAAIGEPPFRVKQLWHWIYHQGVTDFARMSSIARPLQAKTGGALRDRPAGSGGGADQHR